MPFYGNFCNGNAELFGEQEELDVKYPRCKVLSGKYLLCSAAREQFESTLGITDMPNADYAEDGMKSVHEDISNERTLPTRASIKPTRHTTQNNEAHIL